MRIQIKQVLRAKCASFQGRLINIPLSGFLFRRSEIVNFSPRRKVLTQHLSSRSEISNGAIHFKQWPFITSPPLHSGSITVLSIASLVGFFANAHVCVLLRKRSDLRKVPHYLFGSLAVNGIFNSLLNWPRLALTVIRLLDIPVSAEPACSVLVPSGFACNILNAVTM